MLKWDRDSIDQSSVCNRNNMVSFHDGEKLTKHGNICALKKGDIISNSCGQWNPLDVSLGVESQQIPSSLTGSYRVLANQKNYRVSTNFLSHLRYIHVDGVDIF